MLRNKVHSVVEQAELKSTPSLERATTSLKEAVDDLNALAITTESLENILETYTEVDAIDANQKLFSVSVESTLSHIHLDSKQVFGHNNTISVEGVKDFLGKTWEAIKKVVRKIWAAIRGFFAATVNAVTGKAGKSIEPKDFEKVAKKAKKSDIVDQKKDPKDLPPKHVLALTSSIEQITAHPAGPQDHKKILKEFEEQVSAHPDVLEVTDDYLEELHSNVEEVVSLLHGALKVEDDGAKRTLATNVIDKIKDKSYEFIVDINKKTGKKYTELERYVETGFFLGRRAVFFSTGEKGEMKMGSFTPAYHRDDEQEAIPIFTPEQASELYKIAVDAKGMLGGKKQKKVSERQKDLLNVSDKLEKAIEAYAKSAYENPSNPNPMELLKRVKGLYRFLPNVGYSIAKVINADMVLRAPNTAKKLALQSLTAQVSKEELTAAGFKIV